MRWNVQKFAAMQAPEGQSGAADGGAPASVDTESMGDQYVVEPTDPPGNVDAPASENTDEQSMGQTAAYAADHGERIENLEQRLRSLEGKLKHFL